jgi:L-threonylcarbamoyladenylate synthase
VKPSNEGSPRGRVMLAADPDALDRAASILCNGGLVAIPTETVYGLAADIRRTEAIRAVFRAKGRPADHPLIVHVEGADRAREYATHMSTLAVDAMATFWPGPLTILLRRSALVPDLVTGGRDTVAVRCPAHAFARMLIARVDAGLVAPSANRFGHVSPTRASHVVDDLGGAVDLIVDGGPCRYGIESTIVDLTTARPQILREGAVTAEDLAATLDIDFDRASGPSRAPGMLLSHYAPRALVHLGNSADHVRELVAMHVDAGRRVRMLEHAESLPMYAATLYQQLRAADDDAMEVVVAQVPPRVGLGAAIADRLEKAAVR